MGGERWFVEQLGQDAAVALLGELYEHAILRVAEALLRPGDVVVDGGCHVGLHTMRFAHLVGADGLVLAVDPDPDALARNRSWYESTQSTGRVRWCQVALAAASGEAVLHRPADAPGLASLRYRHAGHEYNDLPVTLARLDDLLPDVRAAFVKLDCEGAEFDALLGAEALLRRSHCPVVFESGRAWAATVFGHDRDGFFSYFARLGYVLHDGFGRPFDPAHWEDPDAGWYFWAWPADFLRGADILALIRALWAERRAALGGEVVADDASRPGAAILLAHERSGTHLLRSIVDANGAGQGLEEIANAAIAQPGDLVGFFAFQRRYRAQFPDRFVPNVENTIHLLNNYLDHLLWPGTGRAPPLILDIKYAHVVNFAGGWWNPFWRPALFSVAAERGMPILHLVRRKVFHTAVSGIYAGATGAWVVTAPEQRGRQRITIARENLIAQARAIRDTVILARGWIADLCPVEMWYEELLDPASPSWRAYAAHCRAPITAIATPFIKAIPGFAEVVENLGEIEDLLEIGVDDPWWDQPR